MPTITFKSKIQTVYNMDNTVAYNLIPVPTIARRHCDMHAFRAHPKYGGFANSGLFPSMLKRALRNAGIGSHIRMDRVPDCVTIDDQNFLAVVTINLA